MFQAEPTFLYSLHIIGHFLKFRTHVEQEVSCRTNTDPCWSEVYGSIFLKKQLETKIFRKFIIRIPAK